MTVHNNLQNGSNNNLLVGKLMAWQMLLEYASEILEKPSGSKRRTKCSEGLILKEDVWFGPKVDPPWLPEVNNYFNLAIVGCRLTNQIGMYFDFYERWDNERESLMPAWHHSNILRTMSTDIIHTPTNPPTNAPIEGNRIRQDNIVATAFEVDLIQIENDRLRLENKRLLELWLLCLIAELCFSQFCFST